MNNPPATLLVVSNLEESLHFYTELLNAVIVEQYDNCLKLAISGHQLLVFQGDKMAAEYDHGYHASSTLIIAVSNLDEKIEAFKAKGIQFIHSTPNENVWGRYSAFTDPSGIVFELMEYK